MKDYFLTLIANAHYYIVAIAICILLFQGEPDISDGLRQAYLEWVDSTGEQHVETQEGQDNSGIHTGN